MKTISERARDPLWVDMCEAWDKLCPDQRRALVRITQGVVEKGKAKRESPDTNADTPPQARR